LTEHMNIYEVKKFSLQHLPSEKSLTMAGMRIYAKVP